MAAISGVYYVVAEQLENPVDSIGAYFFPRTG